MKMLRQSLSLAAVAGTCVVALTIGGCDSPREPRVAADGQIRAGSSADVAETPAQTAAGTAVEKTTEVVDQAAEKIAEGVAMAEDVVAETAEAAREAGKEVAEQVREQSEDVFDHIAGVKEEATGSEESHN